MTARSPMKPVSTIASNPFGNLTITRDGLRQIVDNSASQKPTTKLDSSQSYETIKDVKSEVDSLWKSSKPKSTIDAIKDKIRLDLNERKPIERQQQFVLNELTPEEKEEERRKRVASLARAFAIQQQKHQKKLDKIQQKADKLAEKEEKRLQYGEKSLFHQLFGCSIFKQKNHQDTSYHIESLTKPSFDDNVVAHIPLKTSVSDELQTESDQFRIEKLNELNRIRKAALEHYKSCGILISENEINGTEDSPRGRIIYGYCYQYHLSLMAHSWNEVLPVEGTYNPLLLWENYIQRGRAGAKRGAQQPTENEQSGTNAPTPPAKKASVRRKKIAAESDDSDSDKESRRGATDKKKPADGEGEDDEEEEDEQDGQGEQDEQEEQQDNARDGGGLKVKKRVNQRLGLQNSGRDMEFFLIFGTLYFSKANNKGKLFTTGGVQVPDLNKKRAAAWQKIYDQLKSKGYKLATLESLKRQWRDFTKATIEKKNDSLLPDCPERIFSPAELLLIKNTPRECFVGIEVADLGAPNDPPPSIQHLPEKRQPKPLRPWTPSLPSQQQATLPLTPISSEQSSSTGSSWSRIVREREAAKDPDYLPRSQSNIPRRPPIAASSVQNSSRPTPDRLSFHSTSRTPSVADSLQDTPRRTHDHRTSHSRSPTPSNADSQRSTPRPTFEIRVPRSTSRTPSVADSQQYTPRRTPSVADSQQYTPRRTPSVANSQQYTPRRTPSVANSQQYTPRRTPSVANSQRDTTRRTPSVADLQRDTPLYHFNQLTNEYEHDFQFCDRVETPASVQVEEDESRKRRQQRMDDNYEQYSNNNRTRRPLVDYTSDDEINNVNVNRISDGKALRNAPSINEFWNNVNTVQKIHEQTAKNLQQASAILLESITANAASSEQLLDLWTSQAKMDSRKADLDLETKKRLLFGSDDDEDDGEDDDDADDDDALEY